MEKPFHLDFVVIESSFKYFYLVAERRVLDGRSLEERVDVTRTDYHFYLVLKRFELLCVLLTKRCDVDFFRDTPRAFVCELFDVLEHLLG